MEIKILPQDVRENIRSGENISSVPQCVMELVLNSLDSKATAIAVRINLLTLRIQVVDNSIGVSKSNMNLIGIRYMTSKCYSLKDLKKTKQFGFRGEALASICQMAKKVDIVSRSEGDENTYSKTYKNGKWSVVEIIKSRAGVGTTVTITEFMHNLPVRQKRIHKNLDLDETKQRLEELAIINCNISFSLRNDATGKIILQSKLTENVAQALVNFYPYIIITDLVQIKVTKSKVSVTGLICKTSSTNKKLQFIYLNKRPIICAKIQKLINTMLSKIISKGEHPVYCLNIRCPYSSVDLALSPSKTTVEFKNWDIVYKCIEKAIKTVLESEHLVPILDEKHPVNDKKAPSFKSHFGLSQIKGAIKGNKVKRKISSKPQSDDDVISIKFDSPNRLDSKNYSLEKLKNREVNESIKETYSTEIIDKSKKRKRTSDINRNTQSLLFSLDTKYGKSNSLFNHTLTTNAAENQDKGKEFIMDRFLKSTIAYPTEQPQILTDDVKTVVIEKTTKNKCANTTMTMTVVSKKTILKKSLMRKNAKHHKMISKCVQTTMVQKQKMIDFGSDELPNSIPHSNDTFSKYFLTSTKQYKSEINCNPKTIAYFGNFGKNFVPNFGRLEYFFRPVPNFSQNVDFTSIDDVRSCFLYGRNREDILNFSPQHQNPFPLYRPRLSNFVRSFNRKNCHLLPNTRSYNEMYSPYFTNNAATNSLSCLYYPRNNLKNLEISPFFKQPILRQNFRVEKKHNTAYLRKENHGFIRNAKFLQNSCLPDFLKENASGRFKESHKPISYLNDNNEITEKVNNKKSCSNFFLQNSNIFNNNLMTANGFNFTNTENTYLQNIFLGKPSIPNFNRITLECNVEPKFNRVPEELKTEFIKGKSRKRIRSLLTTKEIKVPKISGIIQPSLNLTKVGANSFRINENSAYGTNSIFLKSPFFPQPGENFLPVKKPKVIFFNEHNQQKTNNFIPNLPKNDYLQENNASFQLNPVENSQFSIFHTKLHQRNADNLGYDTITEQFVCNTPGDKYLNSESLFEIRATSNFQEIERNLSTSLYFQSSETPKCSYMQLNCIPNESKEQPRNMFESEKPLIFPDQGSLKLYSDEFDNNSNLDEEVENNFNKRKNNSEEKKSRFEISKNDHVQNFYPNSDTHNYFFKNNFNKAQLQSSGASRFLMPISFEDYHQQAVCPSKKFKMKVNNKKSELKSFRNPVDDHFGSGTYDSLHNQHSPKILDALIETTVKQGPTMKKHRSNPLIQKSKLSLKKHVSDPLSKLIKPEMLTYEPIFPIPRKSATQSTTDTQYKKFKPDLCSTRIEELSSPINNFESSFDLVQSTHRNVSNLCLTTSANSRTEEKDLIGKVNVPEWVQKKDKFGNKFYLNSRTGMTSSFSQKEINKFVIAKRIDFLPKGLSPICVEVKNVDVSMSPNSKKELHTALMKNFENELQTIKWSNFIDDNTDIKDFFRKLYEEKTKHFENCIPNVSVNTLPRCMIKQCKNAQAQSYSKDLFLNLDLIGQWDRKFIIAFSRAKQTLFVFDQHAVSERIRLENLLNDYKAEGKFKVVSYNMNILNTFSESDLKILEEFNIHFENFGFYYTIRSNIVYITHIPYCLYAKYDNNEPECLKKMVISFICDQLQMLKTTKGVSTHISKTLQSIINSEACRGAIKFGDHLSIYDCEKLVKELNWCQLPFQCAHGRPSVVPLINLDQSFSLQRCKPNLRKLKN